MRAALLLLLGLPAFVASQENTPAPTSTPTPDDPIAGGLTDTEVTDQNTQMLANALSAGNYSNYVGDTRVCYSEVQALQTQVVAGTNYYFQITGCDVTGSVSGGACSAETLQTCSLVEYQVVVFEQTWTDTLEVTRITMVGEPATEEPIAGGWSTITVTDENTQLLASALSTGNYLEAVGDIRICYSEVTAVESQVVDGTNYRFNISGCDVTGSSSNGACSSDTLSSCTLAEYMVGFYDSWEGELEVTSIAKVSSGTTTQPGTPPPTSLPGGWSYVDVTDENTQILANALSDGNYSESAGDTRVCYTEVNAVEQQVVAGMNYQFYFTGCVVTGSNSEGACSTETLSTCTLEDIVVDVFASLDGTFEVTGFTFDGHTTTAPVTAAPATTAPVTSIPGGWNSASVTDEYKQLLADALSVGSYSESVGDTRVCYTEVLTLEEQVVAGFNYRFHVTGCDVTGSNSEGACSSEVLKSCTVAQYVVEVFVQSWTNTLEVTSITLVDSGSNSTTTTPETAMPTTTAPVTGVPGGWTTGEVTDDNTGLLSEALTDGNYSTSVGDMRVCYTEVSAVESQVVAGVNYRFHITGCDVMGFDSEGVCSSETLRTCALAEYVVQVFYQSWTNIVEVTSITLVDSGSTTAAPETANPVTTAPSTTAPVSTIPVTSSPVTTAPVTTFPVTTGLKTSC